MARLNGSTVVSLNTPRLLTVSVGQDGSPRTVQLPGEDVLAVEDVVDTWRIDDEWWRQEISRRYWHLTLADGRRITVFEALVNEGWYAQRYGREPTI